MKKIILLFAFSMLFSCSKSDNNTSNSPTASNSSVYNPPAWIQGTWGVKANGINPQNPMYKFMANNFCQLSQVNTLCWKESIEQAPSVYSGSDVATNLTYDINFIQNNGAVTITFKFKKISSAKIIWLYSGIEYELDKL